MADVLRVLFPVEVMKLRLDVLMLLTLVAGAFLQSVLFFLDVPCSGWPMWLSFGGMTASLAVRSPRRMGAFLLLTVCLLAMTAYTFSCGTVDVFLYHFPMQDLLRNGWNPVREATFEEFRRIVGPLKLAEAHTLFLPRFCALCGALVASATGLFHADSFLNYVLLVSLSATAFAFAGRIFGFRRALSALFAFSIVSTTKLSAFLSGLVDYAVYAALLTMMFSTCLYWKDRRTEDLVLAGITMILSMLIKSTGLVVSVLFVLMAIPFFFRDRRFWLCGLAVAGLVLVLGFSPLVTSTIHYASPLYPTVSFSAAHPVLDITTDFTGNVDALRMGYLARLCYAWVSPQLTAKVCAFVYGRPDFDPVFTVFGGVEGFGTIFRLLLVVSVLALLFARKNLVTGLCAFLFLTTLVTPLKYVGYSRYFLQVWAIPPLAVFNFFAHPLWRERDVIWSRVLRSGVVLIPIAIAVLCGIRSLAFYGRTLGVEKCRQVVLSELRAVSPVWRVDVGQMNSYAFVRRLEIAGIRCLDKSEKGTDDLPEVDFDGSFLWACDRDAPSRARSVDQGFPVVNSIGEIVRFPWAKAFLSRPRVLWNKKEVPK